MGSSKAGNVQSAWGQLVPGPTELPGRLEHNDGMRAMAVQRIGSGLGRI